MNAVHPKLFSKNNFQNVPNSSCVTITNEEGPEPVKLNSSIPIVLYVDPIFLSESICSTISSEKTLKKKDGWQSDRFAIRAANFKDKFPVVYISGSSLLNINSVLF